MLQRTQDLPKRARRRRPDNGVMRRLMPTESDAFAAHLTRLDPSSRHSRFGGGVSDFFIAEHASRALRHGSIVHGWFVDGTLRAAVELHPLDARRRRAEAAFSVEREYQDSGIGTALMRRTLLAARNRGMRELVVHCVADNRRMQAIARRYGAALEFASGDVVGEIRNPQPTPLSLWRELVADGHGFAGAAFDLQARVLRAM